MILVVILVGLGIVEWGKRRQLTCLSDLEPHPILRCMDPEARDAEVWIGVVGIVQRKGCELLSPDEGAYVNFLTLAASDSEYRAKVMGVLSYHRLELLKFEDVRPLSASDKPSEEILQSQKS